MNWFKSFANSSWISLLFNIFASSYVSGTASEINEHFFRDFFKVKKALEGNKIAMESGEIELIPKSTVKITGEDAKKVLDLVNALEEHEDVQHVYANFDIPDDLLKE